MKRFTLTLCFTVLLTSSLFAQQTTPASPQGQPPPSQAATPPRMATPQPAATVPAMQPPPGQQTPRPGMTVPPAGGYDKGQWSNVKVDVTISDSLTATFQQKKTVTVLTLDDKAGQIRSTGGSGGLINVDARPSILRDGRIVLQLTVEYQPELSADQLQQANVIRGTALSESLYVVLLEGRPTVISQSSDPRTDRKVSLEVTATIVK